MAEILPKLVNCLLRSVTKITAYYRGLYIRDELISIILTRHPSLKPTPKQNKKNAFSH